MRTRPLLTLDLDGVLCRPPFGINPGRGVNKRRDRPGTKGLLWATERWRYTARRPMPGAVEGFALLTRDFDCHVLSARAEHARALTAAWFERRFGFCPPLHLRPHWQETAAQFKVRKVEELHPLAHFEDDAHTAQWLAELLPAVFLVDWWRNRWLDAPNIHRIRTLGEAEPLLDAMTSGR